MQNTRLNSLVSVTIARLGDWLRNPWRRLSVIVISLLLGNFLGSAIATIAGQRAELDILVAALLVTLTELVSRLYYSNRSVVGRWFFVEVLNTLKVGLIYSLFVEAFKLGS